MKKDGRGQLRVEFRNCSGNVPGSSKGGVTWGHLVLSKSRAGGPGVCTDPGRETVPRGGGPWDPKISRGRNHLHDRHANACEQNSAFAEGRRKSKGRARTHDTS